jgi:hypothetical protein
MNWKQEIYFILMPSPCTCCKHFNSDNISQRSDYIGQCLKRKEYLTHGRIESCKYFIFKSTGDSYQRMKAERIIEFFEMKKKEWKGRY